MSKPSMQRLIDREMSWLSFNERVLQEAVDTSVPVQERLRFLAIFSSNLDEFFRVRVASLRALLALKSKTQSRLEVAPRELLRAIRKTVDRQQEDFGRIFREMILAELAGRGMHLIGEGDLDEGDRKHLKHYFKESVAPLLEPRFIFTGDGPPFLHNRSIYLIVRLKPQKGAARPGAGPTGRKYDYAIVEIPTATLSRFVELPRLDSSGRVMMLDDLIRIFLPAIFPGYTPLDAWSVKLTRDADLYIDDEFSGDLLEKIKRGLHRRRSGPPSRFLYDLAMPRGLLRRAQQFFALDDDDLVPGGRYHNFNDFFAFPNPIGPNVEYPPMPPLPVARLDDAPSVMEAMGEGDLMLHYPYQSFDYLIRLLDEASADPAVESISMTLYRVAGNSRVVAALAAAARNGKRVTAFVEIKARFDEETNLRSAEELEEAGAHVIYSLPGLKVHSKLLLIERAEEGEGAITRYGVLSSGNFNEKSARVYCDHALFTTDSRLLDEAAEIFSYLKGESEGVDSEHLLVAPFNLRRGFTMLVQNEIANAAHGRPAEIIVKVNSLEDPAMIEKLYEASSAGVNVRIIVRGICCLIPGVKGLSKGIEARSIVDRFLEHARVFIFHNGGDERIYVASSDWMGRNLDRRIEVAFPIYDESIRRELRAIIDLQLSDNVKARLIDRRMRNRYVERNGEEEVRSQVETYQSMKYEGGRMKTPTSPEGDHHGSAEEELVEIAPSLASVVAEE